MTDSTDCIDQTGGRAKSRSTEGVNVDSSKLIKPTRWHVKHEDMHVTGEGTWSVLDALDQGHVLLPARAAGDPQDAAVTREKLSEADSRLLLMSLVALTGDEALLDRFAPYIKAQFGGGAKGVAQHAIPPEMEAELRNRIA